MKVTIDEPTLPILRGLALRQARQRLLSSLLRQPSLWPYVEPSGINRDHFRNNPKWQEAFDMVRGGADISALVVGDPTCETTHLWRLGIEMDAGAMLSLARQIVASVRAEEAAAEVAETAPRSSHRAESKVIDVSVNRRPTAKPVSVTAADVVTAKVDAVLPDARRRGIATTEPKLVPPATPRSRAPAGKLAEAMRFLRDELQGEVAAAVVEAHARKAGIAIKTLKRARAKLEIVSQRHGFGRRGKFYLSLPWDHSGPTGA
jgi:hypothetical protein